MSEDDEPVTEVTPPVVVPETNRLWRLTPALNLLEKSRQIAIVHADTEDDARAKLPTADPMGRDWRDPLLFTAESIETPERHVMGDVIFRSTPQQPPQKTETNQEGLAMPKKTTESALEMWAADLLMEAHALAPCPENKERIAAVESVLDRRIDECPAC